MARRLINLRLWAMLRGGALTALAALCYGLGYIVGAVVWLALWCVASFVSGFKAVR